MSSEYIMLTGPEVEYGDKNLLHTRLDLLSMIKRYKEFEGSRKDELVLKILLRKKINDLIHDLENIEKLLPKTKLEKEERVEKIKKKYETIIPEKEISTLDTEVEQIRRKLESLS